MVVEEVLPFLEEDHQVELNSKLQTVSFQYHHLLFQASCYPVDMWLEDRSLQLAGMASSGVLVVPLQEQISKAQEFQRSAEGYRETINSLATLVITDQLASGAGEADQSSSGKSETESEMEISVLRSRYDTLEALVGSWLSVCTGSSQPRSSTSHPRTLGPTSCESGRRGQPSCLRLAAGLRPYWSRRRRSRWALCTWCHSQTPFSLPSGNEPTQ